MNEPEASPPIPHGAFVAGATGYTGNAVVAALRRHGIRTVAHVRPDSSRLEAFRARFEALGAEVDTTPWEPEPMVETLRRHAPAAVFALLGTTRKRMAKERVGYEDVDYRLPAMLLDAAERLDHLPRFVFLSAIGVRDSKPGTYFHARFQMEHRLHASRLPWTIARPSFITGPDREESRPAERCVATILDGALAVAGLAGGRAFRDRWRSISGHDLAEGLVRAALDPEAAGKTLTSAELRR